MKLRSRCSGRSVPPTTASVKIVVRPSRSLVSSPRQPKLAGGHRGGATRSFRRQLDAVDLRAVDQREHAVAQHATREAQLRIGDDHPVQLLAGVRVEREEGRRCHRRRDPIWRSRSARGTAAAITTMSSSAAATLTPSANGDGGRRDRKASTARAPVARSYATIADSVRMRTVAISGCLERQPPLIAHLRTGRRSERPTTSGQAVVTTAIPLPRSGAVTHPGLRAPQPLAGGRVEPDRVLLRSARRRRTGQPAHDHRGPDGSDLHGLAQARSGHPSRSLRSWGSTP